MAASEKDIEETMKLFNQNAANLFKTSAEAKALLLCNSSHPNQPKVETSHDVPVRAQLKQVSLVGRSSPAAGFAASSPTVVGATSSPAAVRAARVPRTNVEGSPRPTMPRFAGSSPAIRWPPQNLSSEVPCSSSVEQSKAKVEQIERAKPDVIIKVSKNKVSVSASNILVRNADSKDTEQEAHTYIKKESSMSADLLIQGSQTTSQSIEDKVATFDLTNSVHSISDSETVNNGSEINSTVIAIGSSQLISEGVLSCQENTRQEAEQINVNILSDSGATFEPTDNQYLDNSTGNSELNACTDGNNSLVGISLQSSDHNVCATTNEVKQEDSVEDVEVSSGSVKDEEASSTGFELIEPRITPSPCVEANRKVSLTGAAGQAVGTVAVLRATSVRRKASAIVSFTTEDFDLFHKAIGKSHTVASIKESLAGDVAARSNPSRFTRRCSISNDHSTRYASDLHSERVSDDASKAPLTDEENISNVSNQNRDALCSSSLSSPEIVSSMQHFEPSLVPAHKRNLARRKTTSKKLMRKSTKRKAHEAGLLPPVVLADDFGDDQDDIVDTGEEIQFSETDSEDENGSSTDESDLEFENQLAEQVYNNHTVVGTAVSSDSIASTLNRQQRIANELLETERNYVKRLHLVDQVFHFKVVLANREHHMFPNDVVLQIFSNIKSIYQFHHDFLLPQLEKRMAQWDSEPCVGDVMRKFAPFLKLYSEYVKNFDHAMNTMTVWMDKSPRFMSIVQEVQKLPGCGNLSLQHHMLEPIQRVPRYELLLKDYLKHLPPDSPDKENTQKALELVVTAASHSNEAMIKMEKFRKLLDINESLGGEVNVVSPTRELVKEGKIVRMSARNGDQIERYLFLFNDLFLVCKSLPLNIGQRQQYHVKSVMTVDELQIAEGDNLATPNTFYVKGTQKSLELHTNSLEEKIDWQEAIINIIEEHSRKKRSRRSNSIQRLDDGPLGWRAPVWIKDQDTSMCMRCSTAFTVLRRRHHCRACGLVVCGKCSSKKAPLAYLENQKQRVCDACCVMLSERKASLTCDIPESPTTTERRKAPSILQVKGSDPSVINGYLMMCCDKRSWQRRFFAVHTDFVLYSFKAHQDVVAITSLPLPGYEVSGVEESEFENWERVFKVHHATQKKVYYFQADEKHIKNRWLDVLGKVVQLEIPSASASI